MTPKAWATAMMEMIYETQHTALKQELAQISALNAQMFGSGRGTFVFQGVRYNPHNQPYRGPWHHLDNSLYKRMQKWLQEKAKLEDYTYGCIQQALEALFKFTQNPLDHDAILPSNLQGCSEKILGEGALSVFRITPEDKAAFWEKWGQYLEKIREKQLTELLF